MTTKNSNNAIYPIIDMDTINNYYKNNIDSKHKQLRISDENCSKDTVSSVFVYRKNNIVIVKAKINIALNSFRVVVKLVEKKRKVLASECNNCKNQIGECKHIIALLFWLLHRNTATNINKQVESKELSSRKKLKEKSRKDWLLNKFKNKRSAHYSKKQLKTYLLHNKLPSLSLYTLAIYYKNECGNNASIEEFINYCKYNFDEDSIEQTAFSTAAQASNAQWHEMRYGRITASKIYEASHSRTLNGALYRAIMGEVVFKKKEIAKGHKLEEKVLKIVEDKYKTKVSRVGLYLSKDYPIFGASPDGVTSEYCIEIKCPQTKNSFKKYMKFRNEIPSKIMAQLQMQMLFCNKKKGLFCLADPDFVHNNHVTIIEVDYDDYFIKNLMRKALIFWENAIFPVLMQN